MPAAGHGAPRYPFCGELGSGFIRGLALNPYLPVMALFGLPGALGMPGTTWPWLIAATFLLLYATFLVTLAAAAGLVAALAPAALRHQASLLENTVAYPLGLTAAQSPAQSPLPGHLLATLGPGGHAAALALLTAAGLAIVASLAVAPPATPAAAARRLAIGLTALFLLSPATRFGYLSYPVSLYAWAILAGAEGARLTRRATVDLPLPDLATAGTAAAGSAAAGSAMAGSAAAGRAMAGRAMAETVTAETVTAGR